MKKVTDLITISELSRLINISRPTLYRYVDDYENGNCNNLKHEFVMLFDFIINKNTIGKDQIYYYCINKFENSDEKMMIEKIKMMIKEDKYKKFFLEILKVIQCIDVEDILKIINLKKKFEKEKKYNGN